MCIKLVGGIFCVKKLEILGRRGYGYFLELQIVIKSSGSTSFSYGGLRGNPEWTTIPSRGK